MIRCAECRGKGLCGPPRCPIMSRFHAQLALKPALSYQGSSPSVFIGSYGYPDLHGGPLLINDSDNPPEWLARNLGIGDLVDLRARTIRGSSPLTGMAGSLQEIALSTNPLEVEVSFEKPVAFNLAFDSTVAPVGLSGPVRKLDLLGNANVARVVDRITSDTDIVATEACIALGESEIDVYQISKLMTAGLLGRRRKFVPTKWAITAVDDTISTGLKKEISRFAPLEEIRLFTAEIFGNRIVCILVPGDWRYEMVEIWGGHTLWGGDEAMIVQDQEGMKKTGYSPISGAYYSARLAACKYLKSVRRSARVIVIRSVSQEYWAPLGTWVIREATRKAIQGPPAVFGSIDEATAHASAVLRSDAWLAHSTLIPELRAQRTLFPF